MPITKMGNLEEDTSHRITTLFMLLMLLPKALTDGLFPNQKSLNRSKATGSLTRQTLIQIAISVTTVIVASTAISYFQIVSSLKSQTLAQLKSHVVERGQREQSIFLMAEDNHAIFKQAWLQRLQAADSPNLKAQFDQLFVQFPDGVTRNRASSFDGKQQAGVFIDKPVTINADIRRRVLTSYDLINAYGPPWHNRFTDLYLNMPENIAVIYWPAYPTWAQDAQAGFDLSKEEYVWVGDEQHNPSRETVWSGAQMDGVAKIWILSCVTPIYVNDKIIGTLGQDILLSDLFQRTIDEHVEGGYNLIFRADGRLIAHPELMDEIQQQKGAFNILDSGNSQLKNIFNSVKAKSADQVIIDNPQDTEFLAVTQLKGPDWYFVTVLPKSILTQQATVLARSTFFLGLASLLIVVAVVFWVLRRRIAIPLEKITSATNRIASGDFQVALDDSRQDELGRLAHAFNTMAHEVAARTMELQNTLEQQSISVHQTTATMDELNASSRQSAEQAAVSATGAQQVLTLAEAGTKAVGHTLEDMADLRQKVEEISQQISQLSEQTNQIGNISDLVSDFANQTNMLSLNAAVEAARAGEHGKGFAVVAGEIRKLADQSKKSAERINTLVTDVKRAISSTVVVTDEGTKTVEQGVKTAQETSDTFINVIDAINHVVMSSQQISLTAKQQAIAIQQVVDAMNALNQGATQTTTAMSGKPSTAFP